MAPERSLSPRPWILCTGRFAFIGLLTCIPSSCANPDPQPVSQLTPLPHSRHGHRAHCLGDELIVFGGFGSGDTAKTVDRGTRETWIQALRTGTWRRGPDLPTSKAFFASAVVDGAIFALGNDVEKYDPAVAEWRIVRGADSLQDTHLGAAAVGRKIYAVGGYPASRSGVRAFDVDTGNVTELEPPPGFTPGDHFHFVACLDGKLHVVGGLSGKDFTPKSDHWVLNGDRWRSAAPAPGGIYAKFAVHANTEHRLFVFAGAGPDRRDAMTGSAQGLVYDARDDTWRSVEPAPRILVMSATVVRDGKIHVLGGDPMPGSGRPALFDIATQRWLPVDGR